MSTQTHEANVESRRYSPSASVAITGERHITIILSRAVAPGPNGDQAASTTTYDYRMPVPHDASPADVGRMVAKAYKMLEGKSDDSGSA